VCLVSNLDRTAEYLPFGLLFWVSRDFQGHFHHKQRRDETINMMHENTDALVQPTEAELDRVHNDSAEVITAEQTPPTSGGTERTTSDVLISDALATANELLKLMALLSYANGERKGSEKVCKKLDQAIECTDLNECLGQVAMSVLGNICVGEISCYKEGQEHKMNLGYKIVLMVIELEKAKEKLHEAGLVSPPKNGGASKAVGEIEQLYNELQETWTKRLVEQIDNDEAQKAVEKAWLEVEAKYPEEDAKLAELEMKL
jgi:hypothetical protein